MDKIAQLKDSLVEHCRVAQQLASLIRLLAQQLLETVYVTLEKLVRKNLLPAKDFKQRAHQEMFVSQVHVSQRMGELDVLTIA